MNPLPWTKWGLITLAVVIVTLSLLYTHMLANKIAKEERKKVTLWAKSVQFVANSDDMGSGFSFVVEELIKSNTSVPAILVDENGNVLSYDNIQIPKRVSEKDKNNWVKSQISRFEKNNPPIEITNQELKSKFYVYYTDSTLLQQLRWFPYMQLALIIAFVLLGYISFNNAKKAQENRIWVGLAKETAHQLGTPISGLIAWVELLKNELGESHYSIEEINKDVERLKIIVERFSKIGSTPELKLENVVDVLENMAQYTLQRLSQRKRIALHFDFSHIDKNLQIYISRPLFEWVIENLVKNAVDAIPPDKKGEISIVAGVEHHILWIEVRDNGKGIPVKNFKRIFKPGFTTKQRGWGLGLSLTKRIIEQYHKGKIYVKDSVVGVGTILRIELPLRIEN
ncbi:MAG: HAMP domain-containing histidine kinase [Bacteroidia bacterium]|nr:HAMP domain-containing histidine kinase [Bacteroidia bacterium]MDW8347421.1 HAMP domain-containing sensor histidine kinase [Bacteroidia bacterium]